MKQYLSILQKMPLFESINNEYIFKIIEFLNGHVIIYEKSEMIYDFLECIEYSGIVLEGEVNVTMLNFSGNQYGVRIFKQGDFFAGAYACLPKEPSLVRINAQQKTVVLFIKLSNLYSSEIKNCPQGYQMLTNLLKEIARRNLFQNAKVQILIQNKIRDKLMVFIHSVKSKDGVIILPFNRQALANHLGVDRSALSREMSKMKEDGLIDFYKNKIYLKKKNFFDSKI